MRRLVPLLGILLLLGGCKWQDQVNSMQQQAKVVQRQAEAAWTKVVSAVQSASSQPSSASASKPSAALSTPTASPAQTAATTPAAAQPAASTPAQTSTATSTPSSTPPPAQTAASAPNAGFTYDPAGSLKPADSGQGNADATVWDDSMRFPLKCAPAFANSQVYDDGGAQGTPGTGFCDASNYKYPWHDNFCESRGSKSQTSWMCPAYSSIHQGQDIRADTSCSNKNVTWHRGSDGLYKTEYPIVAVDDGIISYIGTYSVYLDVERDGQPELKFTYLHMEMDKVHMLVKQGEEVKKGQVIGYLSNQFHLGSDGKPVADETTPHLHFEIETSATGTDGQSHFTFVPPYTTLVTAYKKLLAAGNAADCPK